MQKKTSIFHKVKILFLAIIFLSLLGSLLGLFLNFILKDHSNKNTSAQGLLNNLNIRQSYASEKAKETEEKIIDAGTIYPDGKYQVGKDIPQGIYKLYSSDEAAGFYQISKSASDQNIDLIETGIFPSFTYISLSEGEFFDLIDATASPKDEARPYDAQTQNGKFISGKYLVGKDIPSGHYTVYPALNLGYIEISSSPVQDHDILLSKYIKDPQPLNLVEGQYLLLSAAFIRDTP